MSTAPCIEKQVVIAATPEAVWRALTTPREMVQWMGEPQMQLEVVTDWSVGSPILIRGFHHARFENRGTVLRFEPHRLLGYSHLSSLSRLPDTLENRTTLDFAIEPGTALTLQITGFPTESILKHLDFYWRGTLGVLKRYVEQAQTTSSP